MSYKIIPSNTFENDVKKLYKKYKKIKSDLKNLSNQLKENPTLGTPLGNDCYKIRLANSSIPTGKRGGFRVITLIKIIQNKIILLTIYSKTEKENITDDELEKLLQNLK